LGWVALGKRSAKKKKVNGGMTRVDVICHTETPRALCPSATDTLG
jgi:hypothetical protein